MLSEGLSVQLFIVELYRVNSLCDGPSASLRRGRCGRERGEKRREVSVFVCEGGLRDTGAVGGGPGRGCGGLINPVLPKRCSKLVWPPQMLLLDGWAVWRPPLRPQSSRLRPQTRKRTTLHTQCWRARFMSRCEHKWYHTLRTTDVHPDIISSAYELLLFSAPTFRHTKHGHRDLDCSHVHK